MNEWSSPQSHSVSTRLRSTPFGRGGAGGTSPFAIALGPVGVDLQRALPALLFSTPYIELLPRTPGPSRHSHASACVFSSGFALNT